MCTRRGAVLWNPVGGGTDAKWLLGKKFGSLEGGGDAGTTAAALVDIGSANEGPMI